MIYGYCRISKRDSIEEIKASFDTFNCAQIFLDDSLSPKAAGSPLSTLKTLLVDCVGDSILVIDSISSLGKTSREISHELEWLRDNNVSLFVIDLPTTIGNSAVALDVLCELYSNKASEEREHVAAGRIQGQINAGMNNIKSGRPLTPYPENWNSLFSAWQSGDITAVEFMNEAKLKKGTFYNLIKRYKAEVAESQREII